MVKLAIVSVVGLSVDRWNPRLLALNTGVVSGIAIINSLVGLGYL